MVDAYKTVLPVLKKDKRVSLFAILKMDVTDRWSLLVSGTGLKDEDKRRKLYTDVGDVLEKELSEEEMHNIARLGVFSLEDRLVKDILKYEKNDPIIDKRANSSLVREGYVLIKKS